MIDNKLRTPGRKTEEEKYNSQIPKKMKKKGNQDLKNKKKKESENVSQEINNISLKDNIIEPSDQIKVYLAEIYTLNQKIEQLNNDLKDKNKNEEIQKIKESKLKENINENEEISKKKIEDLNILINDLKLKNSVLEEKSEYKDLVNYYESKINELQETNLNNIHMFSNCINKYMKNYILTNKDDVWRKLLKTYENKICDLEKKIIYFEGQERKMKTRQIFFEKFCYKAEKRIEEISKKCEMQNTEKNELKKDIKKYKEQLISNKKEKNEKIKETSKSPIKQIKESPKNNNKTTQNFKREKKENPKEIKNENFKNLQELKEKEDWERIKRENQNNINKLYSEINENNSTEKNLEESNISNRSEYDSKNIIMLLNNIHEFIKTLLIQSNDEITLDSISKIINDIKNYTIMLFDKIKILNINQCYIIDLVCDLNKNLTDSLKQLNKEIKNDININNIMIQLKTTCSKLTNEFKP